MEVIQSAVSQDRPEHLETLTTDNVFKFLEAYRDSKDQTVLQAVIRASSVRMLRFLSEVPVGILTINHQNVFGETALHLVAGQGDLRLLQTLLQLFPNQFDFSVRDRWGRTPSEVAVQNGFRTLVGDQLLPLVMCSSLSEAELPQPDQPTVEQQNVTRQLQQSFLAQLSQRQLSRNSTQPTVEVRHVFSTTIESLTGEHIPPATTATPDTASSPVAVHNTSQQPNVPQRVVALSKVLEYPIDIVWLQALLDTQLRMLHYSPDDSNQSSNVSEFTFYDINGKDAFGYTALHKACLWHFPPVVKLLLSYSYTPDVTTTHMNIPNHFDINLRCPDRSDNKGGSAVHMCVQGNAAECLELLLSHQPSASHSGWSSVDLTIPNGQGLTPLQLAEQCGASDAIRDLLKRYT